MTESAPSTSAFLSPFADLGEELVRLSGGGIEVWFEDRRVHFLEDLTGMHAAERIGEIARQRADSGSECFLALCGGTTPGELYRTLATPAMSEKVPWEKVRVFFGDERDVPQDHVENNYRMVTKTLLDHVPLPLSHVHPMPADCRDMSAAACIQCRECEERCPQAIPISEWMPEVHALLADD